MKTTEDEAPIRLLIIDDNQPSRLVQTYAIKEKFDNVIVSSNMQPPPMEEILSHDGVILDERLIGESGVDIARRIHEADWLIPLMIMSTLRTNDEAFEKAYEVVDYVATKGDPAMFFNITRAFLRQIRRIRAARAGHPR